MRLSSLVFAVLLFVLPALYAQHSSGGGSSSVGSSSSGGSHGGYSGGSSSGSSSSSSHSSRGSPSSSSGHRTGGSVSGASGRATAHPDSQSSRSNAAEGTRNVQPRHGILGFLRHPFGKPAQKVVQGKFPRPVCTKEPCRIPCARGSKGGCVSNNVVLAQTCPAGQYWGAGGCFTSSLFRQNDCSSLGLALSQQAQRMRYAESLRQDSCSRDAAAQECSELAAKAQNEEARYKSLQQQYEQCRAHSVLSSYPSHFYSGAFPASYPVDGFRELAATDHQ